MLLRRCTHIVFLAVLLRPSHHESNVDEPAGKLEGRVVSNHNLMHTIRRHMRILATAETQKARYKPQDDCKANVANMQHAAKKGWSDITELDKREWRARHAIAKAAATRPEEPSQLRRNLFTPHSMCACSPCTIRPS